MQEALLGGAGGGNEPQHTHGASPASPATSSSASTMAQRRRARRQLACVCALVWSLPLALAVARADDLWGLPHRTSSISEPKGRLVLAQVCACVCVCVWGGGGGFTAFESWRRARGGPRPMATTTRCVFAQATSRGWC
jgi:hypothetical protein